MANPMGSAAPPVKRLVEATMICFSEEAAPAGKFAVRVACKATRSFEFWRRGDEKAEDARKQNHAAGSTTTMFPVANLAELRSAAACRGTLRGMLETIPQLQALRLTEDEWNVVIPLDLDVVPGIVGAARRSDGFTFCFRVKVSLRVIHDERTLLMACKEWLASTASGENDCSICVDGLEQEPAVKLPGCEQHAFHRRCISEWFNTARTCPICRGDVWRAALPVFVEMASTGWPAQGTNITARD